MARRTDGGLNAPRLWYNLSLEGELIFAVQVVMERYCVRAEIPYNAALLSKFRVRVRPLRGRIVVTLVPNDAKTRTLRYLVDAKTFVVTGPFVTD